MFIASTQDDRVDILAGAVNEMRRGALHTVQFGNFLPIVWPVIAHGGGTMCHRNRFCTVFPTL